MAHRTLCVALTLFLAGCGAHHVPPTVITKVETQTVEVPVVVHRTPPPELTAPVAPKLPTFVSPDDAKAASALTSDGEHQFQALIEELLSRIAAWQAWASAP